LAYLSLAGLQDSVPSGDENYCSACFTAEYPTPLGDKLEQEMELFEPVGAGPAASGKATRRR